MTCLFLLFSDQEESVEAQSLSQPAIGDQHDSDVARTETPPAIEKGTGTYVHVHKLSNIGTYLLLHIFNL